MNNERKKNQVTNLIPFPFLKERLVEKGLDFINQQKYEEASDFLLQAFDGNELSNEILMALMLSLYESRQYVKAREIYESIPYPTIEQSELYLLSLIQMSDHGKVIETIETLLDSCEITGEKRQHYNKLIQFSQRQWNTYKSKKLDSENQINDEEQEATRENLRGKSIQEQISFISSIRLHRLKPYEEELVKALGESKTNPFIQTLILELLREHELDKDIELNKMNKREILNPVQLLSVFDVPYFLTLEKELDDLLGHHDPVQLEQVIEVAKRHAFLWFPIPPIVEPVILARGYEVLLRSYYDPSIDLNVQKENNPELKEALNLLQEWERITETINL